MAAGTNRRMRRRPARVRKREGPWRGAPRGGRRREPRSARVEQGLAAGVNVLCGARSVYRWRGEIREAGECLLLAQVAAPAFAAFRAAVVARHPHVTPCILGLAVAAGHAPFVRWIRENSAAENSAENS